MAFRPVSECRADDLKKAAVLLDPETHKVLGATWRLWQEGDTPTPETQAAVDRQKRMARERRRCCGK